MLEKVAQLPLLIGTDVAELLTSDSGRSYLEWEILPAYIQRCRWYRSKNRKLAGVVLEAWGALPVEPEKTASWFTILRVSFEEGDSERYTLPLSALPEGDAAWDPLFRAALLEISMEGTQAPLGEGVLKGIPFSPAETRLNGNFSSQVVGGEQSNTAFVFSTGHFLKLYRHLEEGLHPEPEILGFLKEVGYPNVPAFRAGLEWQRPHRPSITVAMVQDRIETGGNAWEYVLSRLKTILPEIQPAPAGILIPEDLAEWTRILGRRTAGLHVALGSRHDAAAFAPEHLSTGDLATVRSSSAHLLNGALDASEVRSPEDRRVIQKSLTALAQMENILSKTKPGDLGGKIRIHGDLHLGQVLRDEKDIWFIDFEGEPARPLSEKRRKHSPLRDAAGMLRSFHYAAYAASLSSPSHPRTILNPAIPVTLGELFLEGYYDLLGASDLLPEDAITRDALLDFFILEKAVYELHYELNNRPDWVEIPLSGLKALTRVI